MKNVYIDKLDDIVNKCSNTYHRAIKRKPVDVPWTYVITDLNDEEIIGTFMKRD